MKDALDTSYELIKLFKKSPRRDAEAEGANATWYPWNSRALSYKMDSQSPSIAEHPYQLWSAANALGWVTWFCKGYWIEKSNSGSVKLHEVTWLLLWSIIRRTAAKTQWQPEQDPPILQYVSSRRTRNCRYNCPYTAVYTLRWEIPTVLEVSKLQGKWSWHWWTSDS